MLTVTNHAKDKLLETLLASTDDREIGLRLSMKSSGQLGLVLDRGSPADVVIEHEGLKLLLVEPDLVELLQGSTIDIQDTPDGPKLVVSRKKQG